MEIIFPLVDLLLILLIARAGGELAERFGHSSSVGELLAGATVGILLVAGLDSFVPFDRLVASDAINITADVGILFLLLWAGIEMRPREIAEHSRASLTVALGGVAIPFTAGFALGWLVLPEGDLRFSQALLMGVALSITAIPATAKICAELGIVHTRLGETILAAAIFDDVIGLFLLAFLTAVIHQGHPPSFLEVIRLAFEITLFFAITITLGVKVYPTVSRKLRALAAAKLELTAIVFISLLYAVLAELLALHWIMGPLMAGIFFEPARVGWRAYNEVRLIIGAIASGIVGPIFFAKIGLHLDLAALVAVPAFVAALVAIGFAGKLVGAGVPAYFVGMSARDATAVGVGMSSRGAMELVILSVALDAGLFVHTNGASLIVDNLFSALVIMAVATTLLSPIMLKKLVDGKKPQPLRR